MTSQIKTRFPLKAAQQLTERAGIYQRLKASRLYDWYWRLADRRVIDERRGEVTFYRKLLTGFRAGDLIFDIGANHGGKTDIFLRLGARVVAVDPDQANQEVLTQKFLMYRLRKPPVVLVPKAVSDRNAVETMWIDTPGSAKNTLSRKWVDTLRADEERFGERLDFQRTTHVHTVTLDDLIGTYGMPYFVKIDVEGFEPSVLRGLHRRVPCLSFEVNLPEFRPEGFECVELLERVAVDGQFNYAVDCQGELALSRWLDAAAFRPVFERCSERSVEVFWRTTGEPVDVPVRT